MGGKIKTTGELRDFLSDMLLGIKNGDLDPEKARNITKMAGQINESFYAEIKVAKTRAFARGLLDAIRRNMGPCPHTWEDR